METHQVNKKAVMASVARRATDELSSALRSYMDSALSNSVKKGKVPAELHERAMPRVAEARIENIDEWLTSGDVPEADAERIIAAWGAVLDSPECPEIHLSDVDGRDIVLDFTNFSVPPESIEGNELGHLAEELRSWPMVPLAHVTGDGGDWLEPVAVAYLARILVQEKRRVRGQQDPTEPKLQHSGVGPIVSFPKIAGATYGWSAGTDRGGAIRVGDSEFLQTVDGPVIDPEFLVPSSFEVGFLRGTSEQRSLPLRFADEHEFIPTRFAEGTITGLSLPAAKIGLLRFAHELAAPGRPMKVLLGDLARILYPNASKIQKKQLATTNLALRQIESLFAYIDDVETHERKGLRMFNTVWCAGDLDRKHWVQVDLNSVFRDHLHAVTFTEGQTYCGTFLLNFTALMAITKDPVKLRTLVRAFATFNSFRDKDQAEVRMHPDHWLRLINTTQSGTVSAMRSKGRTRSSSRARRSDDLYRAEMAARALGTGTYIDPREKDRSKREKTGNGTFGEIYWSKNEIVIARPDELPEAWRRQRFGDKSKGVRGGATTVQASDLAALVGG